MSMTPTRSAYRKNGTYAAGARAHGVRVQAARGQVGEVGAPVVAVAQLNRLAGVLLKVNERAENAPLVWGWCCPPLPQSTGQRLEDYPEGGELAAVTSSMRDRTETPSVHTRRRGARPSVAGPLTAACAGRTVCLGQTVRGA
jgi:hypothetical protein